MMRWVIKAFSTFRPLTQHYKKKNIQTFAYAFLVFEGKKPEVVKASDDHLIAAKTEK